VDFPFRRRKELQKAVEWDKYERGRGESSLEGHDARNETLVRGKTPALFLERGPQNQGVARGGPLSLPVGRKGRGGRAMEGW